MISPWIGWNVSKPANTSFAFEMSLPESDRHYDSVDLVKFHAQTEPANDDPDIAIPKPKFKDFMSRPPVEALVKAGEKPDWRFRGLRLATKDYGSRKFSMLFEDASGTVDQVIDVTMRADIDSKDVHSWLVENVDFVD
ncbi:MAG: hypothetical protein R3C05_09745 [Pirellulaceae bacterium]